ncbi:MAG: hypothetical protein ACRD3J_06650 [Thermoanaerobaculia bacterium]
MATAAAMFTLPLYAQSSRDSAGVLIVENARPAWRDSERLWLAVKPRLVIGINADSSYRFRQVRGVMLLTDGRIAVADGGSLQLRIFSPKGRFLSASAGRGTGEGQIQNMDWGRRLRGDTIAISSLSTLAFYSSRGKFLRAAGLPPRGPARPARPLLWLALLNNGVGVAASLPNPAPRAIGTRWTDSLALKLVTESSGVARELGAFPYIELEQTGTGPTPVWLSPSGVFAGGDDRFYAGFGDRYEIRVYTGDGTLQSMIRRSWTPTPITADDWEHWVVEWSKLWVKTTGAERDRDVREVRESSWAEELPAFTQFIVDFSGRLWVRGAHWQDAIGAGALSDIPAVPSTWSVFDIRGRWLGDVTMPTGFQPFEIGMDYVTGILRTGRVNQVVIYDLTVRSR